MIDQDHIQGRDTCPPKYRRGIKLMIIANTLGVLCGIFSLSGEHIAQVIISAPLIIINGYFLIRNSKWLWYDNLGPFKKNIDAFEATLRSKVIQDFKATGVDVIYLDSYSWGSVLSKRCMKGVAKYANNSPIYGHLWLITDLIGLEKYASKNGLLLSVTGGSRQSWAVLDVEIENILV